MPTSWKRADDNALRAHLQEALAERVLAADAQEWSYSDYDIAAIRQELNARQVLLAVQPAPSSSGRLAQERSPLAAGQRFDHERRAAGQAWQLQAARVQP